MTEAKDGFDLIDFPCDFQFKAMVRVSGLGPDQSAEQCIEALVAEQLPELAVRSVSSAASRTGRFESISITLNVPNRESLEAVYEALAADDNVVMTL